MEKITKTSNCSDHMANERTFLAWIRTSLGIIAFGFVLERFALFMKQMSFMIGNATGNTLPLNQGYSAVIGVVLVVAGTIMSFLAFIQFSVAERQIDKGIYKPASALYLFTSLLICLVGALLAIYLLSVSR